jgi:hypothetical protein
MSSLPYIQGQMMNFTIATNGNVGIGTSQPKQKLHVMGDVFSSGTVTASNLIITGDYVFFNTTTSNIDPFVITNYQAGPALTVAQAGVGVSYPIAEFYDAETGIAFKIADGGNVGVGTATPLHKLHVQGNIKCDNLIGNVSDVTGLAPSAKIDTTNALNITSGTLNKDRVASTLNATNFNGTVGIGTTIPTGMLDMVGAVTINPPQFPPRALTAPTDTVTNAGLSKFNGAYLAYASYDNNLNRPFRAFDFNTDSFWISPPEYNPTFTNRFGQRVTSDINNNLYYGHWIELQLPTPIYLYSYMLTTPADVYNTPSTWTILGSTNGNQWNLLQQMTDYQWATTGFVSTIFTVNSATPYRYYRMVITKNLDTDGQYRATVVQEWRLYGDTTLYTGMKLLGPLEVSGNTYAPPIMYINADNIGIGTYSPQEKLHIASGRVRVNNLAGLGTRSLYVDQQGVLTFSASDERLKENITPLSYGLSDITQLNPVHFHWCDKSRFGEQRESGLIAQEVEKVMPDMVVRNQIDGTYALDYAKLVPVLIQGMKDLAREVEELKKSCAKL